MKIMDGNKACSNIAYLFSEVCAIYPITPSSPMAENIDGLTHTDLKNLYNSKPKVVEMESEMGAAGALHGALLSGSLASTFTASQGLLLMIPNMYKIAGEMLPGVMHVASRSLATHALSIFGDHQDIYSVRSTGWCMLASTNVEDAQNMAAVAHLSAIKGSLPFVHFFDGFRTSHELNTIEPLKDTDLLPLIDHDALKRFHNRALNVTHEVEFGTSQTEDVYFQCMEARNTAYNLMPDIVNEYMQEINKLTGKDYKPFNYYGSSTATNVIVAMGSVCDTIKAVIDATSNSNIGLVEVHLYRPFSKEYLLSVLPSTVEKIAVLDRTKEAGSIGEPLYLDIVSSLKGKNITIVGGRYGLSSKDTTPACIKAVYDMLDGEVKDNFTVGINDDVTNLSLTIPDYSIKLDAQEFKIYGFGSDGMISASKDLLNIASNSLNKFVQGYFEYDSKKSGGVTISHLRMSDNKINAPYYVETPELTVITKDEYLTKFDILSKASDNSFVLINTIRNEEELNNFIPIEVKKQILEKNLQVSIINGEKIAYKHNIKGKIGKIIEVNILKFLGINNAKELINDSIRKAFATKGEDIVNNNINSIEEAYEAAVMININDSDNGVHLPIGTTLFEKMDLRKGNELSVKDVLPISSGAFPWATSKLEKRNISTLTPEWNKDTCIECGMCAFVCPHAVVRNFAIKDKTKGKPFMGNDEYNFFVGISNKDCTGCGLCTGICPTHSLELKENVEPTDELFDNYENPEIVNKFTIKGSSLAKPRFEFSGACAGCGETPYLRLLTQLYGDEIVIANATGCSSIYGASSPCMPYSIPWANSLFEDNAEFAFGIHTSYKEKKQQIINTIKIAMDSVEADVKEMMQKYLDNMDDYKISKEFASMIETKENIPNELKVLKDYITKRVVWAVGGDGWAYDIGYNGLDHILHSGENVKILVLDTEVYSNTGGQASKSTKMGAVAEFADGGKKTNKKDLFRIASGIEGVYVASICLGANMMQTIKAFKEAEEHNGPALIIAYSPCIEHGIKNGMVNSINEEKLAVECGYSILMRYDGEYHIDSVEPNFDKYDDFLSNEVRYNALKIKNPEYAKELLEKQKENAIKRYEYYKSMQKKD